MSEVKEQREDARAKFQLAVNVIVQSSFNPRDFKKVDETIVFLNKLIAEITKEIEKEDDDKDIEEDAAAAIDEKNKLDKRIL